MLILIFLLLTALWYRAHTFGPSLRDGIGVNLWPATVGETEPLDCDEAAYAYIGHRILSGDVLYRDLTENKPPLGYWLYTVAIALGGYDELAIRIMPIPFVLATMAIVWWIVRRLGDPGSGCLAAGLFLLLSTDPYLFGNGANLEHFINFFSIASLGLLVLGWDRSDRWWLLASGACLGAAALVKQVAVIHAFFLAPFLLTRSRSCDNQRLRRLVRGGADVALFVLGFVAIVAAAVALLVASGAGWSAFDDIMVYGRALATDTLPDPFAPSALVRWLTGNADPQGRLPWPFGTTGYLVWWGSGSWPLWLASIPATAYLLVSPKSTGPRRLAAAWTISACAQVVLPGLYWQHYYLLPIAGVAIVVGVWWSDALQCVIRGPVVRTGRARSRARIAIAAAWIVLLSLAIGSTVFFQIRDYLLVAPEDLTIRYKGGRQWVVLRQMGRELARRATVWNHPHLYVWGWQSPLHFYAKLDSPTRHFFVDNLLRDQADRNHPLIEPRIEEIGAVLRSHPPELIFTGYRPFRELDALLRERYLPSQLARGLWVDRNEYARFERRR
jgi:4-amino-4-deoxy-L-arabinose transferase-like glycosyltransferase